MAEVSKAARTKARELAEAKGHADIPCDAIDALAELLQQVSDVATDIDGILDSCGDYPVESHLREVLIKSLILPELADPLVAALKEANEDGGCTYQDWANALPDALAKRGLKIVSTDV